MLFEKNLGLAILKRATDAKSHPRPPRRDHPDSWLHQASRARWINGRVIHHRLAAGPT